MSYFLKRPSLVELLNSKSAKMYHYQLGHVRKGCEAEPCDIKVSSIRVLSMNETSLIETNNSKALFGGVETKVAFFLGDIKVLVEPQNFCHRDQLLHPEAFLLFLNFGYKWLKNPPES